MTLICGAASRRQQSATARHGGIEAEGQGFQAHPAAKGRVGRLKTGGKVG